MPTFAEIVQMYLDELDTDHDGYLNFTEFCGIDDLYGVSLTQEELYDQFLMVDNYMGNGDGVIQYDELYIYMIWLADIYELPPGTPHPSADDIARANLPAVKAAFSAYQTKRKAELDQKKEHEEKNHSKK